MDLIEFKHSCVISREVGYDNFDSPISDVIYSGPCLYEEGGHNQSYRYYTRNPLAFLPPNDKLIKVNDVIKVVADKGREISAIIRTPRDIKMDTIECTRLELKLAEDEELAESQSEGV